MSQPDPGPLLHTSFHRQAAASPEGIALRAGGATVRYGELAEGASRLAGALRAGGIGPGRYVGLHLERSIDSVLATLAILDTGAAVVPLPPSYPESRLREILDFSGLDGVIAGPGAPLGSLYRGPVFRPDDDTGSPLPPTEHVGPDSPAFVLCSSGSTGTPKMIVRSHRSFFHRLEWTWRELPFQAGERCCQKSPATATHAVYELFEPLLAGVPVTLIGDDEVRNLEGFWDTIRTEGLTRLLIVPSLLRASLDMPGFVAPPLRALTLMGEAVDGALADLAVAAFAATPSIVSIYGSTEASSSLVVDLRAPRAAGEAPALGVPLDGTIEALVADEAIVDDALAPAADGMPGMLYLGGPQLFTEYFKDPGETAAAFVHAPDGRRLYRTADIVRRDPDGSLHFVGRTGDIVKVRGFRVDLREVEAALAGEPGVRQVAVVPVEHGLAGFVVPASASPSQLTRALRERLPAQMIPSVIVALDELPRAGNGKIDRSRLAADWRARPAAPDAHFATGTERQVAESWRQVLGPVAIAPSTSFFEAGGTSLTVFAVVHRLRAALGLEPEQLTDRSLYRYPVLEELARHLDDLARGAAVSADPSSGIVVSLKAGADPTLEPLFLIAPAGGNLGPYDKVVARLEGPRPVLGVRDPFLWGDRDPTAGFGDWVGRYLEAIRERQPAGPYRIVAYSSAAAFGYELARRLRRDGDVVTRLILVDPVALDATSWKRYGYWALRARWLPPAVVPLLVAGGLAWGRLRHLLPAAWRDRGAPESRWPSTPEELVRFADEVRRDRGHLQRLSVLLELSSRLPFALGDAELAAARPEEYVGMLLERFRLAGSDLDAELLDRMVVQYELQVRTQHAYRLRTYDGDTTILSPASPFAGLLTAQFSPYLDRLETRALSLGRPSKEVEELARAFDPGLRPHYLCMRDDTFAAAVASELDRLCSP